LSLLALITCEFFRAGKIFLHGKIKKPSYQKMRNPQNSVKTANKTAIQLFYRNGA
jgi:hypothetical protein